MTAYNGVAITYDEIGNPLNDGTWSYTWENGRQLASMTDGTTTWNYEYDANGMRTSRTNGTTTYKYVYNGGQLIQMTIGSTPYQLTYDANGRPASITYRGATYYYVTNLQGDVVMILNSDGAAIVVYDYDAWGNIVFTSGSMASTLGVVNPLRYRGYVYDSETSLYYLQSRYYDPEMGRFINLDALISTRTILGNNMFAYCINNPVNCIDSRGCFPCTYQDGGSMLDIMNGIVDAGGGGGPCGIPSCKGASAQKQFQDLIERELRYIKDGTYDEIFDTAQDLTAGYKFAKGLWSVAKGVGMTLLPDPTWITDIRGAGKVVDGLRLIVSAILDWAD